jgi:hypothetical protein
LKAGAAHIFVGFNFTEIDRTSIKNASLILTIESSGNNWASGRYVTAHMLIEDFAHGNGWKVDRAPPLLGSGSGVTWNCAVDNDISNNAADCAANWNGGKYVPATSPGVKHFNGIRGEVEFDVTKDLLNGSLFGWLIKKAETSNNGDVVYYSIEGAVAAGNMSLAPRLIIIYAINEAPHLTEVGNSIIKENENINSDIIRADEGPIGVNENYTLDYTLRYGDSLVYDSDNDGIENITGAIDFVLVNNNPDLILNESNLCTRWNTYSSDLLKSTLICKGSEKCCYFVNLIPISYNWNETFYLYYGLYGATYNNTVSAQVIYVDYNIDIQSPYSTIYYDNWDSIKAIFLNANITNSSNES